MCVLNFGKMHGINSQEMAWWRMRVISKIGRLVCTLWSITSDFHFLPIVNRQRWRASQQFLWLSVKFRYYANEVHWRFPKFMPYKLYIFQWSFKLFCVRIYSNLTDFHGVNLLSMLYRFSHGDTMTWTRFPHYWSFVKGRVTEAELC